MRSKLRLIALCMAHAASALAAINNGVAVTSLPIPDETGAYVFGDPTYSTTYYDDRYAGGIVYPVWDSIEVPSGSTVKFVGGVALSSLPDGCTFDFSECNFVFITAAVVLGTDFTISQGTHFLFQPANVAVSDDVASFATVWSQMPIATSLDVNGNVMVGRNADVVFNGDVTGADSAVIAVNGFSRTISFNDALDFAGKLHLMTSQRNTRFIVNSSAAESHVGTLEGYDWGNDRLDQTHGAPEQLIYTPESSIPCTLVITNFNQNGVGGLLEPEETGHFKYRRWGVLLCTTAGNTIRIENLQRDGAVHLMACSDGAYTFGDEPSFDRGFANFEIVNLGDGANGTASLSPVFYPSPNVNLTFKGRFTGMYGWKAPSFNYTAESNTVNRGSLDMSCAESYLHERQPIRITGYNPWNLPRSIKVQPHLAATTTNIVTDTRWLMPLDFGAADPNEIDYARCETDAILSVPASGTVVVSNATTAAGVGPIPGRYPVITGQSVVNSADVTGADAFANWSIEQAGRWGGYIVELDKTDAGLWMVVKKSGLAIFVR